MFCIVKSITEIYILTQEGNMHNCVWSFYGLYTRM